MGKKKPKISSSSKSSIKFISTYHSENYKETFNNKIKNDFSNNFTCHICNKTFKFNWMLTRHIMQVENRIRYRCKFCNKLVPRINEHHKICKLKNDNSNENYFIIKNESKLLPKQNEIKTIFHFSLDETTKDIFDDLMLNNEIKNIQEYIYFPSFILGEGTFSSSYFGINEFSKKPCVVKIQKKDILKKCYNPDILALTHLSKSPYFPKYLYFSNVSDNNILIESLFGSTLKTLFSFCDHKFDKQTICEIGINLISAFEDIHSKGFLFLDLKPDNIAIKLEDIKNKDNLNARLGLIDLGSSISYIDNYGNYLKKEEFSVYQRANTYFASINHLENGCPSRKDDLETMVYLLIYFYQYEMPWDNYDKSNKEEYKNYVLKEKKKMKLDNTLYSDFEELSDLFYAIKKINIREKPNYRFLKNILGFSQNKILENNSRELIKFSWGKKFYEIMKLKDISPENEKFKKIIGEVFNGFPEKITNKYIEQFKYN